MRIDPAIRFSVIDPTVSLVDAHLELAWPARSSRVLSAPPGCSSFAQTARRAGAPTRMSKRLRAAAAAQPDVMLSIAPGVMARGPLTCDAQTVLDAHAAADGHSVERAIGLLTSATPPSTLLLLAAIPWCRRLDQLAMIVESSADVGNVDDSTALLLVERAVALGRLGEESRALRDWSKVIAVARTPAVIRRRAVLERARFHHRQGRLGRTIQDLNRLDAEIDGLPTVLRSLRRRRR